MGPHDFEPYNLWRAVVERYVALGNPISYIHRTNRHGFKAGALEAGMATAKGELIAIFDADFVPPEDWLMRVVHHFTDSKVGMVQTRWTHLNRDYSLLTQVEAILLPGIHWPRVGQAFANRPELTRSLEPAKKRVREEATA